MLRYIFLCLLIFSAPALKAQENIVREQWADKPTLHTIDKKHSSESAVVILDKRRMEYVDIKDELASYKTFHKIVRVNDDRGIESFNKIYLGVSDNADIVDIKARTVLPTGKVIELDKSNIKDLKDEDGNLYKIFALEGVVKGSEVEYFYTYKRNASFFGREVLQNSVPVLESQVEIISPDRLIFENKSYNAPGIVATLDTSVAGKRTVRIVQKNIPAGEDEKYCAYTANLQRVEYKLSYNTSRSKNERLFTWNELAKRVYESYTSHNEKEMKRIEEFIKKNKWSDLGTEKEKIVAVENFIKKNIVTREDIDADDADNLEKILKNKIASYRGIMRLYGALYQKLNVDFQYVLAGDRNSFAIDKSFENWNNSENPVLFFPAQKKYLAPTRADLRYPWIEPSWGSANALFCKGTTIGNFTTAIGEIKSIALEDYKQTASNVEATVKINPSTDTLLIDIKQTHSGYTASMYRASFNFTSAEQQRQILKQMVKFGTNSENIVSSKTENQDFESFTENKPFVLRANVKANELMERAGNKILVKIGEVIGQQAEMYQEKPRQFPMEIDYPHMLERKIEFVLPEGYKVKNLEELNMNNVYRENDDVTMGFVSNYTLDGNIVKIHVLEEYRRTAYPLTQYEDFKKVINTSADFNKIVLVLEKK